MERQFLKDLGLTDEAIEKIMAENGKDVTSIKSERDDYKGRLETAKNQLKAFDGVNVDDLKGQITKLTGELSQKETDFQQKLSERDFSSAVERAVTGSKARNAKAVMALLDMDSLKSSKNRDADITAALEAVKKENGYLFETAPAPRIVAPTPGSAPTPTDDTKVRANDALRSIFKGE